MVRVSSVVTNAVNIDSKPAPEEKRKAKKERSDFATGVCLYRLFFPPLPIQTMLENKHIAGRLFVQPS
jgi:hypothetical protein